MLYVCVCACARDCVCCMKRMERNNTRTRRKQRLLSPSFTVFVDREYLIVITKVYFSLSKALCRYRSEEHTITTHLEGVFPSFRMWWNTGGIFGRILFPVLLSVHEFHNMVLYDDDLYFLKRGPSCRLTTRCLTDTKPFVTGKYVSAKDHGLVWLSWT